MLTKRAQILFDQQLWTDLTQLSKEENVSVGELVRKALREKYGEEKRLAKRKKAIEAILEFREKYGEELAKGEDSASILRKMREERYGEDHLRRLGNY